MVLGQADVNGRGLVVDALDEAGRNHALLAADPGSDVDHEVGSADDVAGLIDPSDVSVKHLDVMADEIATDIVVG